MGKLSFPDDWRQKLAVKLSVFVTDELSKAFQEKRDKKETLEHERKIEKRLQSAVRQKALDAVCQDDTLQSIMPNASEAERKIFKDHFDYELSLRLLLPEVIVPSCSEFRRISRVRLAITATVGALYGGLFGWLIFVLLFHEGLWGMLFGAALVAGAVIYLTESYYLAVLLKKLSTSTLSLTFKSFFSEMPYSFLYPRNKFLNISLWLFLLFFPWLLNPAGTFNREFCLQWTKKLFESWLPCVEHAVLVLIDAPDEAATEPMQDSVTKPKPL